MAVSGARDDGDLWTDIARDAATCDPFALPDSVEALRGFSADPPPRYVLGAKEVPEDGVVSRAGDVLVGFAAKTPGDLRVEIGGNAVSTCRLAPGKFEFAVQVDGERTVLPILATGYSHTLVRFSGTGLVAVFANLEDAARRRALSTKGAVCRFRSGKWFACLGGGYVGTGDPPLPERLPAL